MPSVRPGSQRSTLARRGMWPVGGAVALGLWLLASAPVLAYAQRSGEPALSVSLDCQGGYTVQASVVDGSPDIFGYVSNSGGASLSGPYGGTALIAPADYADYWAWTTTDPGASITTGLYATDGTPGVWTAFLGALTLVNGRWGMAPWPTTAGTEIVSLAGSEGSGGVNESWVFTARACPTPTPAPTPTPSGAPTPPAASTPGPTVPASPAPPAWSAPGSDSTTPHSSAAAGSTETPAPGSTAAAGATLTPTPSGGIGSALSTRDPASVIGTNAIAPPRGGGGGVAGWIWALVAVVAGLGLLALGYWRQGWRHREQAV